MVEELIGKQCIGGNLTHQIDLEPLFAPFQSIV